MMIKAITQNVLCLRTIIIFNEILTLKKRKFSPENFATEVFFSFYHFSGGGKNLMHEFEGGDEAIFSNCLEGLSHCSCGGVVWWSIETS